MKNRLSDVNDYLFEELERLNDEEELEKDFDKEIKRAKAIVDISRTIIDNAHVTIKAKKLQQEYGLENKEMPIMLETREEK